MIKIICITKRNKQCEPEAPECEALCCSPPCKGDRDQSCVKIYRIPPRNNSHLMPCSCFATINGWSLPELPSPEWKNAPSSIFHHNFVEMQLKLGRRVRENQKNTIFPFFSLMDLRTRVKLGLLERKTFHGGLYMSVVKPDGSKVIGQMVL